MAVVDPYVDGDRAEMCLLRERRQRPLDRRPLRCGQRVGDLAEVELGLVVGRLVTVNLRVAVGGHAVGRGSQVLQELAGVTGRGREATTQRREAVVDPGSFENVDCDPLLAERKLARERFGEL